jgi:hypothetical protein
VCCDWLLAAVRAHVTTSVESPCPCHMSHVAAPFTFSPSRLLAFPPSLLHFPIATLTAIERLDKEIMSPPGTG